MTAPQARLYFYIYGAIMLVLAVLGARVSMVSLIAGGVSGILILIGAWLTTKFPKPAFIGLLVLSILLAGRFLPAFLSTMAFYPAGIIAILTIIGVIVAALVLFRKSA